MPLPPAFLRPSSKDVADRESLRHGPVVVQPIYLGRVDILDRLGYRGIGLDCPSRLRTTDLSYLDSLDSLVSV